MTYFNLFGQIPRRLRRIETIPGYPVRLRRGLFIMENEPL